MESSHSGGIREDYVLVTQLFQKYVLYFRRLYISQNFYNSFYSKIYIPSSIKNLFTTYFFGFALAFFDVVVAGTIGGGSGFAPTTIVLTFVNSRIP